MRYDRELILIKQTVSEDNLGNQIIDDTKRSVLCGIKSVGRSEFYAASVEGLKPELVFTMYQFEYQDESIVEYEGQRYSVIRTYTTGFKEIELTCEKVIGNGKN